MAPAPHNSALYTCDSADSVILDVSNMRYVISSLPVPLPEHKYLYPTVAHVFEYVAFHLIFVYSVTYNVTTKKSVC